MFFDDIYNEKIIPIKEGFLNPGIGNIISILFCVILIYYFYNIIWYSDNKIKTIFILIIIIYLIILYIDQRLNTNKKFSKIKMELNEIKPTLNTGDIIMFRCYYLGSFGDIPLYKILLPIIQETFFTHIGMIYKDKTGNVYILENNGDQFYCHLTKKIKTGSLLLNFNERLDNLDNYRIHVVKTNLYKYININKLNQSIDKYKEHSFLQDGIYCVNYIMKLLEENDLFKMNSLLPPLPIDILNKENYKCDIIFEEPIIIKDIL
jgi:hypothetical protein